MQRQRISEPRSHCSQSAFYKRGSLCEGRQVKEMFHSPKADSQAAQRSLIDIEHKTTLRFFNRPAWKPEVSFASPMTRFSLAWTVDKPSPVLPIPDSSLSIPRIHQFLFLSDSKSIPFMIFFLFRGPNLSMILPPRGGIQHTVNCCSFAFLKNTGDGRLISL